MTTGGGIGSGERPDDGLFDWVADFENPVVTEAQARRAPRAASRVPVPVLVGGGALLAVVATVITALLRPFEAESGLVPTPSRTPQPPVPTTSTSATAEPETVPDVLPASCDDLYGEDMVATFAEARMEVNQDWTGSREAPAGTADPGLRVMLEPKTSLDCFWLDANGGADAAVLTSVAVVSPAENALIADRLVELGFAQQNDRGGTRYFVEHTVRGETVGESHFLRDGVWFATNWYGFGPWGYTGHMVDQVF